jgi:pheromone shutdown protein TraB
MVSDNSTNIRLENVERAVGQLTDRVGDIAKFMERLVSIEERNGFMTQKHEELKESFKESIAILTANHQALEKKVTALQEKMIRMLAIFSVITGIAAFVAPYIVKALMSSGAPV